MNLMATKWTDADSGCFIEVSQINLDGSMVFAVRERFGHCLSTSLEWDHEPIPSERSPKWLESHRFHDWQTAASALERGLYTLPEVLPGKPVIWEQ